MAKQAPRKTPRKLRKPRSLSRVVELLWEQAEGGNVTAQKALYEHYRRGQEEDSSPSEEWDDLYRNVTPLRRRA